MKLMYAVWGSDPLSATLRGDLAAAGASRMVVHVDDDAVADAQLRLTTYDEPVHAVVSVWTEGDPAAATEALRRSVGRLSGWVVEERCPIPPPRGVPVVRADALVNVALLRTPEDLPREEWLRRWLDDHTEVAMQTQATFGYVQNVVVETLVEGPGRVDALVEEHFPMAATTDLHAFYGSDGDDAELRRRMDRMLQSVARFGGHENLDVVPTSRYAFDLS